MNMLKNSFSNIENIMSCTMLVNVLSIILIYDLQCYTSLLMRADQLSDDQLEKYYNLMIKMSAWVTEPIDHHNCFLA